MNTWVDICGYCEFFGGDILLNALKNHSVSLRTELWSWLAENLPYGIIKIFNYYELKVFSNNSSIYFYSPS